MKAVACVVLVVALAGAGSPAVAGAPPTGGFDPWLYLDRWLILEEPGDGRYTLGLERLAVDDLLGGSPGSEGTLPGIRFDSAFTERDRPAFDGLEPDWRLLSLKARASSRLWAGTLTEEAEVLGYGPPEPSGLASSDLAGPRLLRLNARGAWGRVESGMRFQSVSPGLEKVTGPAVKPDREELEAWLAARLGPLRLRVLAGELHDDVADDPRRGTTTRTQAGATAQWTMPSGSLFGLGLNHGRSERAAPLRGPERGRRWPTTDFDSLVASGYHYGGPRWDVTLASTYTMSADTGSPARKTALLSHDFSVSIRPTPAITLTPAVSLFEDAPRGAEAGSRSLSASLSVTLAPLADPLDLTLYGGYTRSRTADGAYDGQSLDTTASLVWHLRRSPPTATLSFQIGYDRYHDPASHGAGYEELTGLVTVRVAAF